MKKFTGIVLILVLFITLIAPAQAETSDVKTLRIIGTSDLHGKFMPWDYALNAESMSSLLRSFAISFSMAVFHTSSVSSP